MGNWTKRIILSLITGTLLFIPLGCHSDQGTGSTVNSAEDKVLNQTTFVMGTAVQATIYGGEEALLKIVEDQLFQVENLVSWRLPNSLAASFNENHQADMTVLAPLIELILDVQTQSEGALDVTSLPLSVLWDFEGDTHRVPSEAEIKEALSTVGYEGLSYDSQSHVLTTQTNAQLDLGGVGKGYGVDLAMEAITDDSRVKGAIISAGSSIRTFGTKDDGTAFRVGLRNPRGTNGELIGIFTLTDCSISTSGDYERFFEYDGKRLHHILDTQTGYPSDSGLIAATVIGESSTLCDALTTACMVLGLEKAMALVESYNCSAVLINEEKQVFYTPGIEEILEFTGESEGYTLMEYH